MVRLTQDEIAVIKRAVFQLDPNANIFLFGSRTDAQQRGGDIDLLVLSQTLRSIDSISILKEIFNHLEEQKIDLLIAKDDSDPFVSLALENGVAL